MYATVDKINSLELSRIPYIDKEMGLDGMMGSRYGLNMTTKTLNKNVLAASPKKTIPEAEYAALRDAYSSCMLYKYFFTRLSPYVTVPYIN